MIFLLKFINISVFSNAYCIPHLLLYLACFNASMLHLISCLSILNTNWIADSHELHAYMNHLDAYTLHAYMFHYVKLHYNVLFA